MPYVSDGPEVTAKERRRNGRVRGPFDGRWRAALPVPLRIHDLSIGGCLIQSLYEVKLGKRIQLDLELPYEGWISLEAETLYIRTEYGFAVKFVDVPEETTAVLERVIQRLVTRSPLDE